MTGVVITQVNESPPAEPVAAGALASLAGSDPTRRPARREGVLSSVVAQSAAVLLDQGLSSVTSFLIALLVARHCDKAEYGLYVLGFSLLVTIQFALRSVISVPFTVNCPRVSPRDLEGYLGSTLVHQLVGSALAAAGLAVAAGVLYLLRHDSGMAGVLLALSVASAAVLLRDFVRTTYLAFLRVWANLVLGALSSVLTLALVLWAYWTDGLSASRAYLLTAIGAGLPAATGLVLVSRRLAVVNARVFGDLKRNWDFGKWTLASVVANSLGMRAMPWLVLIWCGSQAVGAFGAQTAIAGLVNPVIIGLASYLTPKLANHAQAEGLASAWRMGMRIVRGSLVAAAVYVAIMVAWGNDLLGLCYSPKYQGLPVEMALLAAAVTMEALTVPLRSLLRVMDRPRTEFWASVVALGVTLVAGAFLIPSAGLVGAAGALASGRAALVLASRFGVGRRRAVVEASSVRPGPPDAGPNPGTILLRDRSVRKRVKVNQARTEALITQAAHQLGESSGLFGTPRVLSCDEQDHALELERIDGLTTLNHVLNGSPGELRIIRRVGRALAFIHEHLRIPQSARRAPGPRWSVPGANHVALHGDFNTLNICYRSRTDSIVLLDWASASALGPRITIGPRYIDLAQCLRSLLVHQRSFPAAVRHFRRRAEAFLDGYQAESNTPLEAPVLKEFLKRISSAHLAELVRLRRKYTWPCHVIIGCLSHVVLQWSLGRLESLGRWGAPIRMRA